LSCALPADEVARLDIHGQGNAVVCPVGRAEEPDDPYMDAPGLPSFQFVMAGRNRLHPYIRTLYAASCRCP